MPQDAWQDGARYERYIGRWSRLVASEFLAWLSMPVHVRWLDFGCGTGALTGTIVAMADPRSIVGVDPSEGFIRLAREQVTDPRATFIVGTAERLPLDDAAVDVTVSGLVLNFIPDAPAALRELVRVTGAGGTIAAYVWDNGGQMQLLRYFWEAAVALDPAARALDEGQRFVLCHPDPLANLFRSAQLTEVEVRAIDAPTRFRDFDDYWVPFLGGQGPAPTYVRSLPPERLDALRDRIHAALPVAPDGSISLIARAWAVCGKK